VAATKPDPDPEEEPLPTVVPGPFGEEEPEQIPAIHARSVARNTTYDPRTLDIMAELQRQLREGGHEPTLKPFGASELVAVLAEMAAPRLAASKKPDLGRILRQMEESRADGKTRKRKRLA